MSGRNEGETEDARGLEPNEAGQRGGREPDPASQPAAESHRQPGSDGPASGLRSLKERVSAALGRKDGLPPHLREKLSAFTKLERFTERAKQALTLAEQEAHGFSHNYIGTEHLLLGLMREGDGVAAKILIELGVELDRAREAVAFIIGRGARPVTGAIGLTPRSKNVIELAVDEARRLNHNYVGTEHLLLGLMREGEGVGAGVLENLSGNLERVRARVLAEFSGGRPSPEGTGPKDNVVTCRVDGHDLWAIDLLVEAGIRSTRSDAAQWLIHTGIEANQSLLDQVRGTVAEIRRLRLEAQVMAQKITGHGSTATGLDAPRPKTPDAPAA